MTFTYDRPSNHPTISIKEREYIECSIGEGQDKRQRVCLAHLEPAVYNLSLLVPKRVLLTTAWCVSLNEGALGSNSAVITFFVYLCI